MSLFADLNALRSEQEKDEAAAVTWWKDATDADKLRVWARIQQTRSRQIDEVVSRFAQLGMTHIALLAGETK